MPHPLPEPNEGWGGMRETLGSFSALPQSSYPYHVGDFDYPTGHGGLSQDLYVDLPSTAAGYGAVEIFTEAVEKARQGIKQNLVGSGEVSETVNLKLSIDLKSKGLEDLPDEVVDIVKRDVESLKLDYNHIWHIPYKFEECVMLKYLNLRNNRFKDFPKALYRLPRLEVLDLSRNKLVRISEDIKNMRALRVLSLGNNMIENVPPVIASLDIRILKLAGNPLNPDLMKIVEGGTVSPSRAALPDNERDVIMTRKLKKYLRSVETAARDSGGESSDETVSTPRAPRRTLSHRFPVKPSTSESESASDINLTIRSPGFAKPPIPARSHYRVTSGLQDGPLNPIRRPGLTPLPNGNERNRSNSESVLQATQNNRSKRMGIVTRKQNDLGTLDERANRNSFHLRGQSDGSSLSDRYNKTVRNNEVNPSSPLKNDRQQGLFVRRLSSLPEQKRESKAPDRLAESAKGVLYSVHLVHPHLATLIPVVKEKPVKNKSGLEKIYRYASNQLKVLDSALHELDNRTEMKGDGKQTRNTDALCACEALMMTYQQLGEYLLCNANRLVSGGDQRYVRTLFLLLYGSVTEGRNAIWNLISTFVEQSLRRSSRTQTDTIHEEPHQPRDRSLTPTNRRPNPERRQRIGIPVQPPATMISFSPASGVQTAVPLYVNGRSRSNSRTGPFIPSNTSSVANTPRSGESFMLSGYGTPKLRSRSNSALGQHVQNATQIPESPEHEALFEKIFISLSRCVEQSQRIIPVCLQQFTSCLDVAHMSFTSQRIHLLWSTLISRCNVSLETSTAMQKRLSAIKLHEPDVRHSKDFWRLCSKLLLSLEKLMSGVRDAKLLELISTDLLKNIHPLQKSFSETGRYIKSSPWEHLTRDTNTSKSNSNSDAAAAHNHNQQAIYQNQDGSYRHRARTGSGNSPYPTNVPATPLSAALGPAAQATVPTSAAFDRTFAGDVFQRADELLRVQQTMVHRR